MKALRIIVSLILLLVIAFPMLYGVAVSFFPKSDFNESKARLFPSRLEFRNYYRALNIKNIGYYILNSVGSAALGTIIKLFSVILGAFAFSHLNFYGKKAILIILMATLFIPQDAILFQNYMTISSLHLLDTWLGIALPLSFSASSLILLTLSFSSSEKDYYDASRLDGAGDFRYISSILLPLNQSVVLLISIQAFVSIFNSFLWPLVVTNKAKARTLQIAITMLGFMEEGDYGAEMASIVLLSLFFVVITVIFKKRIEKALENGINIK